MTQHDTPEVVEAMAVDLKSASLFQSYEDALEDNNKAADMLRRLHQRAVAAAWAAGAEAMREASLVAIATLYDFHDAPSLLVAYEEIEALPIPPMPTQGGKSDE